MDDLLKSFANVEKFVDSPAEQSLRTVDEWIAWSQKIEQLVPKMTKFAKECEEIGAAQARKTNWHNLPDDLKLECIKWMDTVSKAHMKMTGKHEKSLIEMENGTFDELKISSVPGNALEIQMRDSRLGRLDELAVDTLKEARFKTFTFDVHDSVTVTQEQLNTAYTVLQTLAPFRFSEFRARVCHESSELFHHIPLFVLANCATPVERIEFETYSPEADRALLAIPALAAARTVVHLSPNVGFLPELTLKWIENDAPIGTVAHARGNFDAIRRKFADRIVSTDFNHVRIRTNNPEKHVLVSRVQGFFRKYAIVAATGDEDMEIEIEEDGRMNWSDLPEWAKRNCMKFLDLKTKGKMRRTAKQEKALAESMLAEQWHIAELKISCWKNACDFGIVTDDDFTVGFEDDNFVSLLPSLFFFLKNARVGKLTYTTDQQHCLEPNEVELVLAELRKLPPVQFSIDEIEMDLATDCQLPIFFLINSATEVSKVHLYTHSVEAETMILNVSQFSRVRNVSFDDTHEALDFVPRLIEKWIQTDAPIGTAARWTGGELDSFLEHFEQNRFVICARNQMRILTNNPTKQILVEKRANEQRSCSIISTRLLEP